MGTSDPNRFNGRCKALYLAAKPATSRALHPLLLRHFPVCSSFYLDPQAAWGQVTAFLQSPDPKAVFLDVDQPETALSLIRDLLKVEATAGIIAIIPQPQSDLILPCLRMGAADFLIPPFTEEQVERVAQNLIKGFPAPHSSSNSTRLTCVMPVKGACGATTLACALAYEFRRQSSSAVLLADLDPFTGTVGFSLKAKSTFSFADFLNRAAEMDEDLWRAMVTQLRGVDLLLSPELPVNGVSDLSDAGAILDFARCTYGMVVVDAGAAMCDWSLSQAAASDDVLLVSSNDIASLYSAERVLRFLDANGVEHWKIKLVLNRYDGRDGVSRELIQNSLGLNVFDVLPVDDAAVRTALMEGKPVAPSSNLGKRISKLTERLMGKTDAPRRTSPFAQLASLFTRSSP